MTVTPRGIIVLEGADSSGKTTLAQVLRERYGARYLHGKLFKDPWKSHLATVRYALRLADTGLVVIDRNWLSHLCYGQVFHNQAYDVGARMLDRVLRRACAVTVLCVPSDPRRQETDWRAGAAAGKVEHFPRVREVINLYLDLARGNVAHPGDGYLDQLIRFQDFADRDDVLTYDRYAWAGDAAGFAAKVIHYLALLRSAYPYWAGLESQRYNLTGRPTARKRRYLFVGDWLPVGISTSCAALWPMTWRDIEENYVTWFNAALHHLALDESQIVITNATGPDDHLTPAFPPLDVTDTIVALGKVAAMRLESLAIPHRAVLHPQYHYRLHHAEGPGGYAELLRKVLAP